jgi:acetate kinase
MKRSGLLGVSGLSGDMRSIWAAVQSGNERAKLAFDIYIHRLQAGIGGMIGVLGGIDALVFTAYWGELGGGARGGVQQLPVSGPEVGPFKQPPADA